MKQTIMVCKNCGDNIILDDFDQTRPITKKMISASICFKCLFWYNYIDNPIPSTYIINQHLFQFVPIIGYIHKHKRMRSDMKFAINMKTGECVGNLERKLLGTVPTNFLELLPDQYRWISRETYERINTRELKYCEMKGCFDRYRCYWYNPAKTEPNGAWNHIPNGYVPGMEMCESFIDKNTMYNV